MVLFWMSCRLLETFIPGSSGRLRVALSLKLMRFARIGWILIAILLLNLSGGMFSLAIPARHTPEKRDAATSEAGTRHIPADLEMGVDTLSLPGQQMSSSAADLRPVPIDDQNLNVGRISAPRSLSYVQSDLLQRQHVFRI